MSEFETVGLDVLRRHAEDDSWRPRTLSASSDGRTVIEYRGASGAFVAKFCSTAEAQRSFRALTLLSGAKLATLRVPEPVHCDAERGLLITSAARGEPLDSRSGRAASTDVLARVGVALRELHDADLPLGETKSFSAHVSELVRPAPAELAAAFPEHRARIERTLDEIAAALEPPAPGAGVRSVPLHRDFHLRQLFDDGNTIEVIDWDVCAKGDPAFDVGYLTAYLSTHFPNDIAEPRAAAFLDGYANCGRRPIDAVFRTRVRAYERFNALRRACRRFRLRDPGWEATLREMIARL